MKSVGRTQVGIVQTDCQHPVWRLPLGIGETVAVPEASTEWHVLVRVLAVALNPVDFKMVTKFPLPGEGRAIGCDFCGIVEDGSGPALASIPRGSRVCGGAFPYSAGDDSSGAFAQWLSADVRLLIRVPQGWGDAEAAALGCVGWSAAVLGLFADPEGLGLSARPWKPLQTGEVPVLVYGGATATGTMATQLLKLSGYSVMAVVSDDSARLAHAYGAARSVPYTAPACAASIKTVAGRPIRHALDCITSQSSVADCFAAMGRAGGRYVGLEQLPPSWLSRRAVHAREIMAFELLGRRVLLGDGNSTYSREASAAKHTSGVAWAREMQRLVDGGLVRPHPARVLESESESEAWESIIEGLSLLQRGQVRAEKLVVRIPQPREYSQKAVDTGRPPL